jgi:hypothetical protein
MNFVVQCLLKQHVCGVAKFIIITAVKDKVVPLQA